MRCEKCGVEIEDDSMICSKCGAEVSATNAKSADAEGHAGGGVRFCTKPGLCF